jgi:hypothetical protein
MRAFEVRRNRKRLCVAGIDGDCVLNTIVDHIASRRGRPELHLHVGGLISATDEHVIWRNIRLKDGDEVTVKIVEADRVDRPRRKYRLDSNVSKENAKAYVLAVAKKYGWKVITSQKVSQTRSA